MGEISKGWKNRKKLGPGDPYFGLQGGKPLPDLQNCAHLVPQALKLAIKLAKSGLELLIEGGKLRLHFLEPSVHFSEPCLGFLFKALDFREKLMLCALNLCLNGRDTLIQTPKLPFDTLGFRRKDVL